jgi:hypothetical protein
MRYKNGLAKRLQSGTKDANGKTQENRNDRNRLYLLVRLASMLEPFPVKGTDGALPEKILIPAVTSRYD